MRIRQAIRLIFFASSFAPWVLAKEVPLGPVVALATENQLTMGIGKYEPGAGWISLAGLTRPSEPGDLFTVYTMAGEVAQVKNIDPYRSPNWQTPIEWSARITRWYSGEGVPMGIAVYGRSPVKAESGKPLPLDSPDIRAELSKYLATKHLDVPSPIVTQAYEVRLPPEGSRSILVTAHSDRDQVKDDAPAAIYALAVLLQNVNGEWRVIPFEEEASYKPKSQTLEEHQTYYGVRDSYRFLALPDLDGDQQPEIAVYLQRDGLNQVDLFTWDGQQTAKVLSTYKHTFN